MISASLLAATASPPGDDRVVDIDHGRITEVNEPNAFFDSPQHERIKVFLPRMPKH